MKIKSIAAICKKQKTVIIHNTDTKGVILNTGAAAYMCMGLPNVTEKELLTIFDIDPCKWGEWRTCIRPVYRKLNFEDIDPEEELINRFGVHFCYQGVEMEPLMTRSGIIFLDTKYLVPFADLDSYELYARITPEGSPYIAVKAGMILVGLIAPMEVKDNFCEVITEIAAMLKSGVHTRRSMLEDSKHVLYVDPGTGEIKS